MPLGDHRNQAAVKVQKTYKSFRTRRLLADCAVPVEQRWWKLVGSIERKHKSILFFDIAKHETAVSHWSRAMTKAAMNRDSDQACNSSEGYGAHWVPGAGYSGEVKFLDDQNRFIKGDVITLLESEREARRLR